MKLTALATALGIEAKECHELLELFLETGQLEIDRLTAAFADGDTRQMARIAHTIIGSAGNLGLMEISTSARKIELACITGRLDAVGDELADIQALFNKIASVDGIRCTGGNVSTTAP